MIRKHLNLILDLSEESYQYMESSARIRKISVGRMMERLLKNIFDDQLILSILDDDSKPVQRLVEERSTSHYRQTPDRFRRSITNETENNSELVKQ
jgi:hypothetical protein